MRGPAAKFFMAGAEGKHQNNIRRDWFRRMANMKFDHRVPKLKVPFYFEPSVDKCLERMGSYHSANVCFVGTYIMGRRSTYGVWT